MFKREGLLLGAAVLTLTASACESNQNQRDVSLESRYTDACGSYASWDSEAQESRQRAMRRGGNPNTDFYYQNQKGAADGFLATMNALEREHPELNDQGQCERAMVQTLRDAGRL